MHLFTYGTLMFPEVWRRIALREAVSERASLSGFAIYRVKDSIIPGIVQTQDGDCVEGVLYWNLDEEMLFELDAYESEFYSREPVKVTTNSGQTVDCQAYIVPADRHDMLSDERWDADWFAKHKLASYLNGD